MRKSTGSTSCFPIGEGDKSPERGYQPRASAPGPGKQPRERPQLQPSLAVAASPLGPFRISGAHENSSCIRDARGTGPQFPR
ncbi:hypothetical protein LEMLEM_LOCUS23639 [Lemmus lemmus]